jgi:hypothetical protein
MNVNALPETPATKRFSQVLAAPAWRCLAAKADLAGARTIFKDHHCP